MKQPILSIVIPTYNRYQYLYDCVNSIREIDSDELEIVIQDNTENNEEFAKFIQGLDDSRIKYYHKAEHVSVIDNCNMGVAHATGEYICMIGDDDTICANILKAVHYLKDNSIEGCNFPFPGFNWPDMTFENGMSQEPNMFFKTKADGTIRMVDAKKELMESGCKGGLSDRMPRLYHGMVAKTCMDRIYNKVGTYFPGPSPDMANAVATCLEIEKSVYLSDYLIVSGYSHASARGEGRRNQHFGRIQDKPWLPKDTIEKWDENIPQIFSGETIIAQSATQALKTMGADKQFKFDYSGLYAVFFWHHKSVSWDFLKFIIKSPRRSGWFIKGVWKRFVLKCRNKGNTTYYKEYHNVRSLAEAKKITEELSSSLNYYEVYGTAE